MNFNDYQKKALSTDVFDASQRDISSQAFFAKLLGLVGETGEVADKFKKIYRDNNGIMSAEQLKEMEKELGDVLWYVSTVAAYLGLSLDGIAELNLQKLEDRKNRGKLSGSGDNR
jgi:NTP pyrophosphatase (non-canonical NTP hydrolase)